MANELDKTIEELEAEVLEELEEANGNEPKAGATKMDKMRNDKEHCSFFPSFVVVEGFLTLKPFHFEGSLLSACSPCWSYGRGPFEAL